MSMDEVRGPDGEAFEGWTPTSFRGFDAVVGPYYWRVDEDSRMRIGFRAGSRHLNGMGAVHGGCLMAFADSALFILCREALGPGLGVTVTLSGEYVGPAFADDFIEATGEVTRSGGALVFARGMITAGGRSALTFSGVIKRIRPK